MTKKLSKDYIIGLIEGEGSFTFSTWKTKQKRIPSFQLKMHIRNTDLITSIRDSIGLNNKIYTYDRQKDDGSMRYPYAMLIVREIGNLKNIVVPFFYGAFKGDKSFQFENWLMKIGTDPWVPKSYKTIYRLHKSGYYKETP